MSDKIGELWIELQKTEERLRSVGGSKPAPAMDCFVPEMRHDQFDAPVFTALGEGDLSARIKRDQTNIAAMVAAVVADIDGKPGAPVSPLFAKGRAQLMPAATVEGAHSKWASKPGSDKKPAAAQSTLSPAEVLAQKAALHHGAKPAAKSGAAGVKREIGKSGQGRSGLVVEPPTIAIGKFQEMAIPEPRFDRDLPGGAQLTAEVRRPENDKPKRKKKKRPLWLRILWG
jgi:hypothetical protein